MFNSILDVEQSDSLLRHANRVKYQKVNSLLRKLEPFGFVFGSSTDLNIGKYVILFLIGKKLFFLPEGVFLLVFGT